MCSTGTALATCGRASAKPNAIAPTTLVFLLIGCPFDRTLTHEKASFGPGENPKEIAAISRSGSRKCRIYLHPAWPFFCTGGAAHRHDVRYWLKLGVRE